MLRSQKRIAARAVTKLLDSGKRVEMAKDCGCKVIAENHESTHEFCELHDDNFAPKNLEIRHSPDCGCGIAQAVLSSLDVFRRRVICSMHLSILGPRA